MTKEVKVVGKWDGKQLEQGFKKSASSIKKEATSMSKGTGKLVSEDMGRSMSQFTEKTEKARQLMTAFGGSLGGVAGQVTYYSGTLSYVVGRFSLLEMGVMGAVGAFGALAYGLYELHTGPIRQFNEDIDKAIEQVNDLTDSLRESGQAMLQSALGIDAKAIKARTEYSKLTSDLAEAEARLMDIRQGPAGMGFSFNLNQEIEDAEAKVHALRMRMLGLRDQLKQYEVEAGAAAQARRRRQARPTRRAAAAAEEALPALVPIWTEEELLAQREMEALEEAKRRHFGRLTSLEESYEEGRLRIIEENQDRAMHIRQNAMDMQFAQEEAARARQTELAEMGADAIVGFAYAIAQGNAEAVAETLKSMAIEAFARAAWHGIMALATPWDAARHLTAAGAFAAFGAAYAGGAGIATAIGGGGGGGGAEERAQRQTPTGEERRAEGGGGITIHVHAGVLTGQDAGREIIAAIEQRQNHVAPNKETRW